jgi:hypothetical protein
MRVLHGPVNVGNQPWVLSRNERALGLDSDLVVNYDTWLRYPADTCLSQHRERSVSAVARRALFAASAPFRYDVLHYYFGRSYTCWDDWSGPNPLWFADLRMARRLGRKVFMTLQGCDVRQSDRSAARNAFTPCQEGRCPALPACRSALDERRRALVRDILPLAHRVFVLNPELAHDVPGAIFLPYASVDIGRFQACPPKTTGPITILHAPSDPAIKGTPSIIAAVERLKRRYPIELLLVQGLSHEQALPLYERADLVVDQVLTGWYGGFAVEAMALGKPVACAIRESDMRFVPAEMQADLPLVRLDPADVAASLAAAIDRRQEWPEWGKRARSFVERWHDPARLAGAMISAYRDPQSAFVLS